MAEKLVQLKKKGGGGEDIDEIMTNYTSKSTTLSHRYYQNQYSTRYEEFNISEVQAIDPSARYFLGHDLPSGSASGAVLNWMSSDETPTKIRIGTSPNASVYVNLNLKVYYI